MFQLHATLIQLLQSQPMSLAALAEAASVSLPTLRRAVKDLADHGWIALRGQSTLTGGRPAALYGLADSAHMVLGVHLQLPGMQLAAIDLAGSVLSARAVAGTDPLLPDDALREITAYVQTIRAGFPERRLLGIGIATPGFTDPATGEILAIGRAPQWHHFPIKARLEGGLGLPVVVDNNVDSMAIAELRHHDLSSQQDIIYLGFDEGFKVSIFLGGKRYRGPFGNAGNIGNSVICVSPLTNGNETRQAQILVSVSAVCQAFDAGLAQRDAVSPEQAAIQTLRDLPAKFRAILNAAEAGDDLCADIVTDMLDILAIVVANLLNAIQPNVFIVGGALSDLPPDLFAHFEAGVRRYLPSIVSHHLDFQRAQVRSPHLVPVGIAHAFLDQYIQAHDFYRV